MPRRPVRQPLVQRVALDLVGRTVALGERLGVPVQRWATKATTLTRLPSYLRRLGVAEGLRTVRAFLGGTETIGVAVPGYARPVLVRCGGSDPAVFERIFIADEYAAVRELPACGAILDGGAYVGYSSLYFARQFPGARILAVEPDAANLALLKANTAHCANVVPVAAALWSRSGVVKITNRGALPWSFAIAETHASDADALAALTVQGLLDAHGVAAPDLVKLDIEGAEAEVFRAGAEPWLRSAALVIIELHDYLYPGSSANFFKAIDGLPFDLRASGENVILRNRARPRAAEG